MFKNLVDIVSFQVNDYFQVFNSKTGIWINHALMLEYDEFNSIQFN